MSSKSSHAERSPVEIAEQLIDDDIVDAWYLLGQGADVQTIYELVNFDSDGHPFEDEIVSSARVMDAVRRAAVVPGMLLEGLNAFRSGKTKSCILEFNTSLLRDGDNYWLALSGEGVPVTVKEAHSIADQWISHYSIVCV